MQAPRCCSPLLIAALLCMLLPTAAARGGPAAARSDAQADSLASAATSRATSALSSDPAHAADLAAQAVALAEETGDPATQARARAVLARARWLLGDDAEALREYLAAARLYRSAGADAGTARVLLGLSTIYNRQARYERARAVAREALALYRKAENASGMARAYNALGHIAREAGHAEEALALYREELRLARALGERADADAVASALHNVGMALEATGRASEALEAYRKALGSVRAAGHRVGTTKVLYSLGAAELRQGRTRTAGPHLRESLALADTLQLLDVQVLAHEQLARLAEAEDRPAEAVRHLRAHAALNDTLARRTLREEVARMATRYEADERERQIDLLQAEAEVRSLRMERQQALLVGGGVGLLLMLVLAGALYRTARLRKKANALLETRRREIEGQKDDLATLAAEREVLLREVHHRVKNNFQIVSSLLALQTDPLEDGAALTLARQFQSRVMAMALVHQKLYQTEGLSRIDTGAYVEDLAGFLVQTFCAGPVEHEVDAVPVALSVDTAVPLGLILSELVCNACEHAFPEGRAGTVRVTLRRAAPEGDGAPAAADERFVLTVADDGVGLPPDAEARQAASLGLSLVRDLARQLRGRFEIESRPDWGTRCTVTFRPAHKRQAPQAEVLKP